MKLDNPLIENCFFSPSAGAVLLEHPGDQELGEVIDNSSAPVPLRPICRSRRISICSMCRVAGMNIRASRQPRLHSPSGTNPMWSWSKTLRPGGAGAGAQGRESGRRVRLVDIERDKIGRKQTPQNGNLSMFA
jgi:hypothetical protein